MKADLSIIVTSHNIPHEYILECFQSIRDQTISPKEIIFVDDCSSDPRAHADAVSIILPQNVGVAKARDVGVRMSSGRLLLFLDADDKIAPDFIQQSLEAVQTHDIAYTNHVLFGDVEQNRLVVAPDVLTPHDLLGHPQSHDATLKITVSSMMHRRVYESLQGFRSLPVYEDWDFWIRAMAFGFTFRKAHSFLWYRQRKDSRNSRPLSLRATVFHQITEPYVAKNGTICKREDQKDV